MSASIPLPPPRTKAALSLGTQRREGGQPSPRTWDRIPSLDGLRAVAIALVVIGHGLSNLPSAPPWVGVVRFVLGNGHLGVCMFFSLSGYLITRLLLREREQRGTINLVSFYARRVLRIFPAAYAYVATIAILAAVGVVDVRRPELVAALLYAWNYSFAHSAWFLSHFWSLCLEEQFYLVWPAFLALAGRAKALKGAGAVILLMPAARLITYFAWPAGRSHILIMAHTALDAMMYGCVAALLENDPRFQRVLAVLFRWRAHVVAAVVLLVVSPILTTLGRGAYELPLGSSINFAGCTLLMLWAVQHPRGRVGRWLNSRGMVHLGTISYGLYIWQQLFLAPPQFRFPWVGVFPLNEICALAAAEVSYWLIERPFLRLKARLSVPARAPVPVRPESAPPLALFPPQPRDPDLTLGDREPT